MSILARFISAISSTKKPKVAVSRDPSKHPLTLPTVKFDPKRVDDEVKADLSTNIRKMREFDESNFDQIYDAAVQSISRGGDLAVLYNAIMGLNLSDMTKERAGQIALTLNNKATAIMNQKQQVSLGIKYAISMYSGAPCHSNPRNPSARDVRQDTAHRGANGKRYEVAKGMLLNGRLTIPGREAGCKCASRSIIPGLDP
jgi:uncharacterized protein with gpF-like domain